MREHEILFPKWDFFIKSLPSFLGNQVEKEAKMFKFRGHEEHQENKAL